MGRLKGFADVASHEDHVINQAFKLMWFGPKREGSHLMLEAKTAQEYIVYIIPRRQGKEARTI